jgi:hypothetical protein
VNPSQFKVITHSVKKTDPNDARNLALYLAKDLLPEVRMKDKTLAQIASLTQTRDSMVKLRTAPKNKVNNICSAHGVNLNKESLASEKGLKAVLAMQCDPLVNLELKIIIDQAVHSPPVAACGRCPAHLPRTNPGVRGFPGGPGGEHVKLTSRQCQTDTC